MSDDPAAEARRLLADRLDAAGLDTERFIDVHDGEKRSTDHTRRGADDLDGNYGVYAGGGLVDVDIDDYSADDADDALEAVLALPETFTVESPHTDGETGGHRYYAADPDIAAVLERVTGAKNPSPSWGEIRVHNQYVVGPGSRIEKGEHGCDKPECDDCPPDGDDGWYRIANDAPIASLSTGDLLDVLEADETAGGTASAAATTTDGGAVATAPSGGAGPGVDDYDPAGTDPGTVLQAESKIGTYLALGAADAGFTDDTGAGDRSAADWHVVTTMIEYGVPEAEIRDALAESPHTKLSERGPSSDYWTTTWTNALTKADIEPNSKAPRPTPDDGDDAAATPAPDDGGAAWSQIRHLFESDGRGTSGVASTNAAARLVGEFDVLTVEENGRIWRYDPETGIYRDDGEPRLRERLSTVLATEYSRARVTEILHAVRSQTYVKRETLGAPAGKLCVANGVLDLTDPTDPTLLDHAPEYHFTWRLEAPYDADAEAPEFESFIEEAVAPGDLAKLQQYAGYTLHHWDHPLKRACIIIGPTDAGKGVFTKILRKLFGEGTVASESLYSLSHTRWGTASLYRRPLNLDNELSTGGLKNPNEVKKIIGGGDQIPAEFKGENKFEFVPNAKHIFATNTIPRVETDDEAFYNRWLFVSFPESVPLEEQDHGLDERIVENEAAGVLNWLLEGYATRFAPDADRFAGEMEIADKEELWGVYSDTLDRFVTKYVDVTENGGDWVPKRDLHAAYSRMCDLDGLGRPKQQAELTKHLKGESTAVADYRPSTGERPRSLKGLALTDDGRELLADAGGSVLDADSADDGDTTPTDHGLDEYDDDGDGDRPPNGVVRDALLEIVDEAADENGQARRADVLPAVHARTGAPHDQIKYVLDDDENGMLATGALIAPATSTLERP